jgi:tRNA A-37 threonylcarbamoyl transferase component Bud32
MAEVEASKAFPYFPHIHLPVKVCEGQDSKYLVFSKHAAGTTLHDYMRESHKGEQYDRLVLALETLAHEIFAMNTLGFRHNDVHSSNIMYDPLNNSAVLIDFGLADKNKSPARRGFHHGKFGDTQNVRDIIAKVQKRSYK